MEEEEEEAGYEALSKPRFPEDGSVSYTHLTLPTTRSV